MLKPLIKIIFLLFITCTKHEFLFAQGQWVWLKGDTTANPIGTYGMQGIPSPANTPHGLYEFSNWVDSQGNLWIFGGMNINGITFSDLWKYNPAANEWTWVKGPAAADQNGIYGIKGVPSPLNNPGGRSWNSVCWIDIADNLWLFGGLGFDASTASLRRLNDLWKYNISTNEWTWMSGDSVGNKPGIYGTQTVFSSSNVPGGRTESSVSWFDPVNNELWLFGGDGLDAFSNIGHLDDTWKYNIANGQWAWMNGSNVIPTTAPFAIPPNYGSFGIPAPSNTPGGRMAWAGVFQNSGHLYLFGGGQGFYASTFNDVWDYNIATNEWAWIGGTNTTNHPGSAGTQCISSTSFVPAGRFECTATATDQCGYFYIFGGHVLSGGYNDLWQYNPNTNEWKWISGSVTLNQNSSYGTQGIPLASNHPGNRGGTSAFWIDSNNHFWLFGGYDRFNNTMLNQVWKFIPDNGITAFTYTKLDSCAPMNVQFNNLSTECIYPKTYSWNFGDPASGGNDSSTLFSPSHIYQTPGNYTVTLVSENCAGEKDTAQTTIIIDSGFQISFNTVSPSCISASGQISAIVTGGTAPFTYQWSPVISSSSSISALSPGTYIVIITDNNGCLTADSVTLVATGSMGLDIGNDTVICSAQSLQLASNVAATSYLWSTGDTTQSVSVSQSGSYWLIASTLFCSDTDSVTISIPQQVNLGNDFSLCDSKDAVLDAGYYPGASFTWSTGETSQTIIVNQPDTFWINILYNSCLLSDTIVIADEGWASVYIPNTFTPNGDGINEFFIPVTQNISEYHLSIFNRWGELIFETDNPLRGWDGKYKGKMASIGVYLYAIAYASDCNNSTVEKTKYGAVSLIR